MIQILDWKYYNNLTWVLSFVLKSVDCPQIDKKDLMRNKKASDMTSLACSFFTVFGIDFFSKKLASLNSCRDRKSVV